MARGREIPHEECAGCGLLVPARALTDGLCEECVDLDELEMESDLELDPQDE
jgi:hypothetical protein